MKTAPKHIFLRCKVEFKHESIAVLLTLILFFACHLSLYQLAFLTTVEQGTRKQNSKKYLFCKSYASFKIWTGFNSGSSGYPTPSLTNTGICRVTDSHTLCLTKHNQTSGPITTQLKIICSLDSLTSTVYV